MERGNWGSGNFAEGKGLNEIVSDLSLNSVTMYGMYSPGILEDYLNYGEGSIALRDKWDSILNIPFFACISVGWDNTPRFPEMGKENVINKNVTPESFTALPMKAREYVKNHPDQQKLIIIDAWNEWVEGAYLEPDMRWGYSYLEAVKNVMSGVYDKNSDK